jgi:hypothetical protein
MLYETGLVKMNIGRLSKDLVMHIFCFLTRMDGHVLRQCVACDDVTIEYERLCSVQDRQVHTDSFLDNPRWECLRTILDFEQRPSFEGDHGITFLNFFCHALSAQFGKLSTHTFFSNRGKTEYYFYFREKKIYVIARTQKSYRIVDCIAQT